MDRKQRRIYFLRYSILFLLMELAVYGWLWVHKRTFVGSEDGFLQHYRVLMYYGRWLRQIVKTFLTEGRLTFPEWNFSIGYGANVWTTFHHYLIGDPLALLSVFVPSRYTVYLYCFLVLLRNYLAGISFSCFCFYLKRKNQAAVLAGAFTYVFCAWALVVGTRHPFFVNPMIYLPFVLMGAEKLLRKERPYVFIFAVFISAASNFYFFYMIAIQTAIYVIVRAFCLFGWRNRREILFCIFRTFGFAVTGLLMSMFILFPEMLLFAKDYRSEISCAVPVLYALDYYKTLAAVYTSSLNTENYTLLGFGMPALYAAVLTFLPSKKGVLVTRRTERILFLIGTAFLMIPAAAYALNGFAYVANRWEWGYSLLAAFLLTDRWEELFCLGKRKLLLLAAGTAAYVWAYRSLEDMKLIFVLAAAALVVMACRSLFSRREKLWAENDGKVALRWLFRKRTLQAAMLIIVLAGISWNAFRQYDENSSGVMRTKLMVYDELRNRETSNPDALIKSEMADEQDFWRYTGTSLQMNSSLVNETHNTQFYWSLSNGNITRLFLNLEMLVTRLYQYNNLDSRTMIDTLLGVRYYVCKDGGEQKVPYGYSASQESGEYKLYENENALPIAFTYDSYVTEDQIEEKNGVQKEEAMAQSVVLEEPLEGFTQGTPEQTGEELSYTISIGEGVEQVDEGFLVTQEKAKVKLQVSGGAGTEVYLRLTEYSYDGEAAKGGVLKAKCLREDGTETTSSLRFYTATSMWPSPERDYMLNLGYNEDNVQEITLTFKNKGLYCFDTLSIYSQPLEAYEDYVQERSEDSWTDEVIGTDTVQGTITLEEEKLLFLSIPFDGGWTAYVDGEETELLKANYAFSALQVSAGEHRIVLVYHTPGMKIGILLTLAGILALIVIFRANRKNQGEHFPG